MNEKFDSVDDPLAVMYEAQVGSTQDKNTPETIAFTPISVVEAEPGVTQQNEGDQAELANIRNELASRLEQESIPTATIETVSRERTPEEIAAIERARKESDYSAGMIAGQRNFEESRTTWWSKLLGRKTETQMGILQENAILENTLRQQEIDLRNGEGELADAFEYLGMDRIQPDLNENTCKDLIKKYNQQVRKNRNIEKKIIFGTGMTVGGVYATGAATAVLAGVNTAALTLGGGFGAVAIGGAIWGGKKLYDRHKEAKIAKTIGRQMTRKTGDLYLRDSSNQLITR